MKRFASESCFLNKREKWKLDCFLWSKLSQNDFFHIWIFHRNPVSQKLNSKFDFLEISFSLKYDYSKSFVFDIFRTINSQIKIRHVEKLSIQSLIFQEKVCFKIWLFFSKGFHFKLWLLLKTLASKSCLSKQARKVKKNVVFCWAN